MDMNQARGILVAAHVAAVAAIEKKKAEWLAAFGDLEKDCCGFAWVVVEDGKSMIAKACRAANRDQPGWGHKGHPKGWHVWMPGREAYNGQSLSIYEAGAQAFAQVLAANGVDAWAASRMD